MPVIAIPDEYTALSDRMGRLLFSLLRRGRMLPAAGPLTLVSVIGSWVLLLGLGFQIHFSLNSASLFLRHAPQAAGARAG